MNLQRNSRVRKRTDSTMAWFIKENSLIYLRGNMRRNNSYVYPKTVREAIEGKRHYVMGNEKLPSVTTILS